jgi:hypothetical protein
MQQTDVAVVKVMAEIIIARARDTNEIAEKPKN